MFAIRGNNTFGEFYNGGYTQLSGAYTIQAVGRGTKPKAVQVETSSPVHLSFMIDTGMR